MEALGSSSPAYPVPAAQVVSTPRQSAKTKLLEFEVVTPPIEAMPPEAGDVLYCGVPSSEETVPLYEYSAHSKARYTTALLVVNVTVDEALTAAGTKNICPRYPLRLPVPVFGEPMAVHEPLFGSLIDAVAVDDCHVAAQINRSPGPGV